jgi:hypothetical protein
MFDCGKKSRRGKYMRKCEKRKRSERYNNRFQISFEKSVKREKKMKNRINIKEERNIY